MHGNISDFANIQYFPQYIQSGAFVGVFNLIYYNKDENFTMLMKYFEVYEAFKTYNKILPVLKCYL